MKHNIIEKVDLVTVGKVDEGVRVVYFWKGKKHISYFKVIAATPRHDHAGKHLVSLLNK